MPERRPSRFSSGRSQTSMSRAEPASSATTVPAATSSPSAALSCHVDRRVHFVDHDRHGPQPGDDARLADDDRRPALLVRADEGERRPIVLPVEVLAHGEPDDLPQVVFDARRSSRVGWKSVGMGGGKSQESGSGHRFHGVFPKVRKASPWVSRING